MKVQIPFGITSLQVGTINIYSLKLRFNRASWSFIEPEMQKLGASSALITVRNRNQFYTIQFQTVEHERFAQVRDAINRGQIAQQEEILRSWKETGFRPNAANIYNAEFYSETFSI